MNQVHSTTTEHKNRQHLTFEERVLIQTHLKDGWKAGCIVLKSAVFQILSATKSGVETSLCTLEIFTGAKPGLRHLY